MPRHPPGAVGACDTVSTGVAPRPTCGSQVRLLPSPRMRETRRRLRGDRRATPGAVASRVAPAHGILRRIIGPVAAAAAFGLLATLAIAPLPRATEVAAAATSISSRDGVQAVQVGEAVASGAVSRESYAAETGTQTLVAGGTNYDWATLVLVYGGWPVTEANVTVMVQWMREENGPDNWFNRNNPMNNGQGSGGGSGLGSYDTLDTAAYYAAENLLRSIYAPIAAGLADGTSAERTAQAIWASPWATSHYGYGANWTTSPVPVVEAPPSAWGR